MASGHIAHGGGTGIGNGGGVAPGVLDHLAVPPREGVGKAGDREPKKPDTISSGRPARPVGSHQSDQAKS